MKKFCLLFFVLLLKLMVSAQPGFVWAKEMGRGEGYAVASDKLGNVYTAGAFNFTADFDPGPGVYNLTATGSTDLFISKLDAAGNFIWAKQMGGTSVGYYDVPFSIAVDSNENVYTTGYFYDAVDFDPGPGIFNLISPGEQTIFISKLDASGNFVWAKQFAEFSGFVKGNSIALDISGNIFASGSFIGTGDFDPGPGIYNLSAGSESTYILKLDLSGNFIWAKQTGGVGNIGNSIAVDGDNNIYITSNYTGTADFDPGIGVYYLTAAGLTDIFVSKLDANGNFIWAKSMGGIYFDGGTSVSPDKYGNVYVAGYFHRDADFDPGVNTYMLSAGPNNSDAFVLKLNSSGNLIWAKDLGASGNDGAYSMIANENDITVSGTFQDTVDFDPGSGVYNIIAKGYDLFISKLDTTGNFLCAGSIGGNRYDVAYSLASAGETDFYVAGSFADTVDFDPGIGTFNLSSPFSYNIFVCKLNGCSLNTAVSELSDNAFISIYPNPSSGIFTIDFSNGLLSEKNNTAETKICVYNVLGNCILNKLTAKNSNAEIDLSNQSKGIYFMEIVSDPSSQGYEGRSGERVVKKIILN